MNAIELFISITEPRLKLNVLSIFADGGKHALQEIQTIFFEDFTTATQYLWELYNERLVRKVSKSQSCLFELTPTGQTYLDILVRLLIWIEEHHVWEESVDVTRNH